MRVNGKLVICAFLLVASTITVALQGESANAAEMITARSLTLQAGASDGGSKPGGVVKHLFGFTFATAGSTVGSIKFEYCTTASGTCTMPIGLITSSATMTGETSVTGFSITNTTNGAPYLHRVPAAITGTPSATYQLSGITNPTATNTTFFVRIATYASQDATGTAIDAGTVAASTATQIVLTGIMPESLIFCAGATVTAVADIPNCASVTTGAVSFNQLFSPTDTATATSQMAASTNATGGYTISVNGETLKSGSNTIAGMPAQAAGTRGISQFGMNLKLNTVLTSTVPVGAEISLASNGTDLKGTASTGYDTVDNFKFVSGNTVAQSSGATNAQIYTVSYIVNVPGSQTAGTYTTTLTYICTPTF